MCSEIIFYLIKKAILSGGSRPLLFLDQTEAQRADKFLFLKPGHPYLRVWTSVIVPSTRGRKNVL